MDTEKISAETEETIQWLIQLLTTFNQDSINLVPFEESWTAGQLVNHVILVCSGFLRIMNGPVKETERRPDEMKEKIRNDLLNFTSKLKSPEFVKPPVAVYKKSQLLQSLEDIKEKFNCALQTLDLTQTCVGLQLPLYGYLTRLEAIYFIIYHTQRHTNQLHKIYKALPAGDER